MFSLPGETIVYKLNNLDLEQLKTFGNSELNAEQPYPNVYDIAVDQNGYSIITGSFSGSIDFGTGMKTAEVVHLPSFSN